MTNYEKYKEQIMFLIVDKIGFDSEKGIIFECAQNNCSHCQFLAPEDGQCTRRCAEWLNAEAKEPKEFTVEEKVWAGLNDKIPYYARNENGRLCGYTDKPRKKDGVWWNDDSCFITLINEITSLSFSAIKWEDDEPTSRDEILNS